MKRFSYSIAIPFSFYESCYNFLYNCFRSRTATPPRNSYTHPSFTSTFSVLLTASLALPMAFAICSCVM